MTVPSAPGSPAGRRLWTLAVVLTCCFTVYVIIAPMLYHRSVAAPLLAVSVVADVLAVGLIALVLVLRGREAATINDVAQQAQMRLAEQADRQNAEFMRRDQQIRRQSGELENRLATGTQALREALRQLTTVQLPAALDSVPVPPLRPDGLDENMAGLLDRAVALAASAGDRQESTRTAVVALSRRVQTSAHRIQEESTLMADRRPGDADVLEVSMRVDHAAAQQARHAQSMAVLCGNWPGQQWHEPLPLVDVVRAAAGRIIAYQRVEVAGDPDVAIAAPVVEPAIHLVAELLANATQSAPPTTMVPVTIRSVQRGAVIEIHDCGVGLDEHRLEQAQEIASGRRPVGLDTLGEYPQTGLAVVGQYARRHGFRVDVSESVYGGVRVLVGVPAEVVEVVESAESAAAAQSMSLPGANGTATMAPAPAAVSSVTAPPEPPDLGDSDDELLPRRRSPRHGPDVLDPDQALPNLPGPAAPQQPDPVLAEPGLPEILPADALDDETLPRRRSRRHGRDPAQAPAEPVPLSGAPSAPDPQSPAEAGAWMSAFLSPDPPTGGSGSPPSAADLPSANDPPSTTGPRDVPNHRETQERG